MNRNRIPALLLCAALLLSAAAPAAAAGTAAAPQLTPEESAQELHALGLFQGAIAGRFDAESMALDREASRVEALVMFIRLLGQEHGAVTAGASHPFSDVPQWADPYVGYAYRQGLTDGVGDGRFGSDAPIQLGSYATFLLRALGYQDGVDFNWQDAAGKGLELGLYDAGLAERCAGGMTRGDLAQVSYAALYQEVGGADTTLAGRLVRLDLLDEDAALARGLPLETGETSETAMPEPTQEPESGRADPAADIQAVVDLVNEARAEEGLSPLVLDDSLTSCAAIRAEELGQVFDHTRPDGSACFTVLQENGVSYSRAGENIASGYDTPEQAAQAWLDSPSHRANIMERDFGHIGVGVAGRDWVQLFTN